MAVLASYNSGDQHCCVIDTLFFTLLVVLANSTSGDQQFCEISMLCKPRPQGSKI
jgi:hypothetical protein